MNRYHVLTDDQFEKLTQNKEQEGGGSGSAVDIHLLLPQFKKLELEIKKVLHQKGEDHYYKFKELQQRLHTLYHWLKTNDVMEQTGFTPQARYQSDPSAVFHQSTPVLQAPLPPPIQSEVKKRRRSSIPVRRPIKRVRSLSQEIDIPAIRSVKAKTEVHHRRYSVPTGLKYSKIPVRKTVPHIVTPLRTRSRADPPVEWRTLEKARQKNPTMKRI